VRWTCRFEKDSLRSITSKKRCSRSMYAELREANQSHHLRQVPDLEVPVVATPLAGLRWSEFARRGRIEQLAIRRLSGEGSPMYLTSRSLLLHEALIRVPTWQWATYDLFAQIRHI
jgi:hypothetical protein